MSITTGTVCSEAKPNRVRVKDFICVKNVKCLETLEFVRIRRKFVDPSQFILLFLCSQHTDPQPPLERGDFE